MPSSGAQTDVTVYPTETEELSRWFRGLADGTGIGDEGRGGFAAFKATADQEIDLVDEGDVLSDANERDFVAVMGKTGHVVRVRRKSASGKRVLVARGAFSPLENWQ